MLVELPETQEMAAAWIHILWFIPKIDLTRTTKAMNK